MQQCRKLANPGGSTDPPPKKKKKMTFLKINLTRVSAGLYGYKVKTVAGRVDPPKVLLKWRHCDALHNYSHSFNLHWTCSNNDVVNYFNSIAMYCTVYTPCLDQLFAFYFRFAFSVFRLFVVIFLTWLDCFPLSLSACLKSWRRSDMTGEGGGIGSAMRYAEGDH